MHQEQLKIRLSANVVKLAVNKGGEIYKYYINKVKLSLK